MQNEQFNGLPTKKHFPLLTVVLSSVLALSLIFGLWAFASMMDYKGNSDKKSSEAVEKALAIQKSTLEANFEQEAKSPYTVYKTGLEFGSLTFSYPKSWSMYVESSSSNSNSTLDGYAHPGYVPSVSGDTAFALRFQITSRQYSDELKAFDGQIKNSKVTVAPFRPDKVQSVLGSKITGNIESTKNGVLYILPLRDKTIKIWTESTSYSGDLDTLITSLSYIP